MGRKLLGLGFILFLCGCNESGGNVTIDAGEGINVDIDYCYDDQTLIDGSCLENSEIVDINLKVSWSDLSDNEDGFIIMRDLDEVDDYGVVGTLGANETLMVDSIPYDTISACYRVSAYNSAGSSDYDEQCIYF